MKPQLILISHGNISQEILKVATEIIGEIKEMNIISLTDSENLGEEFTKISASVDSDGMIIMIDLLEGKIGDFVTNILFERKDVEVLTGLNLSLVIEYIANPLTSYTELSNALLNVGKHSVQKLERIARESGNEE